MWSDTQPKNGRQSPLSTRSSASANVSAGNVIPMRLTGTSATWKSFAIGASCAVAINPPAAISTNIRYITQNTGVRAISKGVAWARAAPGAIVAAMSDAGGTKSRNPSTMTITPWSSPNVRNVCS
jgi:hypothetical protein